MSIATWPAGLPQAPLVDAFSEQRQRNLAAFSPDVGAPQAVNRSTAVPVLTSASFNLTDAQLNTFDTFYDTTLADGVLPFTWMHPIDGNTYRFVFAPDASPQKDHQSYDYTVLSCKLLRLP